MGTEGTMKKIAVSYERLEACLCRESFYDFVRRFWDVFIPEKPVWNWHIEFICNELQIVAEQVFARKPKLYDLIINVSRGATKSTISSILFPAWCWTRDPTLRIICGSYAKDLSYDLAMRCRWVLQSEKYNRLFPEAQLKKDTEGKLMTHQGGERFSTSVSAGVGGHHGHIILVDDPLDPTESASEASLTACNNWFDRTLLSCKVDKAVTPVILIMQRLDERDPTGRMLEREGRTIKHICLPAIEGDNIKPPEAAEFYLGGLFDPVRMPLPILNEIRLEIGEYAFAGQYLQRPIPERGGMFLVDQLQLVPTPSGVRRSVRYWDKAATYEAGCYTVGVRMGITDDRKFIVEDVVRGQWEAAERERVIRRTAEMDGLQVRIGIEEEPGSGGKESAQNTVKNLMGFNVIRDKPTGKKEIRADPYAAQVNACNVSLVRGPWNRAYCDELAHFCPTAKYKDQVDASSGAFAMLTKKVIVAGALR